MEETLVFESIQLSIRIVSTSQIARIQPEEQHVVLPSNIIQHPTIKQGSTEIGTGHVNVYIDFYPEISLAHRQKKRHSTL